MKMNCKPHPCSRALIRSGKRHRPVALSSPVTKKNAARQNSGQKKRHNSQKQLKHPTMNAYQKRLTEASESKHFTTRLLCTVCFNGFRHSGFCLRKCTRVQNPQKFTTIPARDPKPRGASKNDHVL